MLLNRHTAPFPPNLNRKGEHVTKWTVLFLMGVSAMLSSAHGIAAGYPPDAGTLALIAGDIENLKGAYPQLEKFSLQGNLNIKALQISYAHRTHRATHQGGWTSGVPNPDEDGVWFYIDFHDPASTSQIHAQPMFIQPQCLRGMRVGFLILEGPKTASVNGALWQVLRTYGVAECRP